MAARRVPAGAGERDAATVPPARAGPLLSRGLADEARGVDWFAIGARVHGPGPAPRVELVHHSVAIAVVARRRACDLDPEWRSIDRRELGVYLGGERGHRRPARRTVQRCGA